jgi:hypothetical protein
VQTTLILLALGILVIGLLALFARRSGQLSEKVNDADATEKMRRRIDRTKRRNLSDSLSDGSF